MKVLIIGFGSIGKRHYEVLSRLPESQTLDLVSRQEIDDVTCYKSLELVTNINQYDYFIIASETNKHFEQLCYLESNVKNKIIFCEKPLFETKKDLSIQNNKVYVGYVLRFHPLLQKLRSMLGTQKTIAVNVICGQYLPTWRPNADYRQSYSAKKEEGGGVLLDLSHEIDYIRWLFGSIQNIKSIQKKISDLEIDSDDFMSLMGFASCGAVVSLSIDYISKIKQRKMLVHTMENSYELDFIANKLMCVDKTGLEEIYSFSNLERNYMFEQMHRAILRGDESACSYLEGVEVMNTISVVQEQNR